MGFRDWGLGFGAFLALILKSLGKNQDFFRGVGGRKYGGPSLLRISGIP